MNNPTITITVKGADNKLSESISTSISNENTFKYLYLKQLVSRLRAVKAKVADKPDTYQIAVIGNTLKVERNIANFAAEQYAELGQEETFDALTEIVAEIDELFE